VVLDTLYDAEDVSRLQALSQEMLTRRRLIMASNRGPVDFTLNDDGTLTAHRGSGGVVTALSAVSRFADVTWIASAMSDGDRVASERGEGGRIRVLSDDENLYVRFVVTPRNVYQRFYSVFCNPLLWFIQHYMWNTPRTPNISKTIYDAWESGYLPVNRAFAEAVAAEAAQDPEPPYVILHDYHLYTAPGEVRARLPGAIIQHFTHIPWPDTRYWELLPAAMRVPIYENLCAADIVGLQSYRDVRNFLLCAEAFVPGAEVDYRRNTVWHDGRLTSVRHYPISVDAPGLEAFGESDEVRMHERALRPYFDRTTIVRVDRAEPSKNLLRGFRAFELLIERYPEWREKVNLLAFIVPSRTDLGVYQTYTDEIFELIDAINDEHGTAGWQPVTAFYENDYAQAIAAMRHYDVLLTNPLIDGMNLVVKEGALVNTHDGVIVLSEAAGAYEQLRDHVVAVAPADIEGTVRALHTALTMPAEERRRRATALRESVRRDDLAHWLELQFQDLITLA
jgi:trehalose 6-phosphate synthase